MKIKVIDVETTGLNKNHKKGHDGIVSCACGIYDEKTKSLKTNYKEYRPTINGSIAYLYHPDRLLREENVYQIRMGEDASKINGFTDEYLTDKGIFADDVNNIEKFLSSGIILTYNGFDFDKAFIQNEFNNYNNGLQLCDKETKSIYIQNQENWIDVLILVRLFVSDFNSFEDFSQLFDLEGYTDKYLGIYNKMMYDYSFNPMDFIEVSKDKESFLMAVYRNYNNVSNKLSDVYARLFGEELEDAHNSLADIKGTYRIYEYIKEQEGLSDAVILDLFNFPTKEDVLKLGMLKEIDGELCLNFGKFIGKSIDYIKNTNDWYWNFIKDNDKFPLTGKYLQQNY